MVDATTSTARPVVGRRPPAGRALPRRAPATARRLDRPARGHQRRRGRVPADARARARRRRPGRLRLGRGPRRRTPPTGSSGSTPSRPASCCSCAPAATTCCGCCRTTTSPGRRSGRPHRASPAATVAPRRARRSTTPARARSSTSPTLQPAVWSAVDLAHRRAAPTCTAQEAPGHDPSPLRHRASQLPVGGRDRRARRPRAAPRHPAGRHRARAGLRLRRLRGRLRAGVGPGAAAACSTAASSSSIAHVRGGGELGGAVVPRRQAGPQAAHLRRPHRGRRRAGRGRAGRPGPDRHPRAERRRAAPGRGLQPAAGPVARGGGGGAVRRRGDARCSTTRRR